MTIKQENRLSNEKSPYLLQHAQNPVDWYPWGEEAFVKANKEDKPIFLSSGYSTCHWCHVMERESFEDEEVADILNKHYVSIKVDREERPDIDHIYMEVCQALTGSGGWPLTIIMTPDKHPFFAGTYFPKESRMGMPGLIYLLKKISQEWENDRKRLLEAGKNIVNSLNREYVTKGKLTLEDIHNAYGEFSDYFDGVYGGFGSAPKFPTPHNLFFLLRYWHAFDESKALDMVEKTLDAMYKGGIYDHIGYGFARYSTDRIWLVPHFEKMLYDNALLAIAYLEAYQITGKQEYAEIAKQVFSYVLRDMTSPEGGFYSAQDADSEGVEGKFYVWTPVEVKEVLGELDGEKFCKLYDITERGNFEGNSIPNLIKGMVPEQEREFVEKCREKLFNHREKRVHPYKDDKILTAWNGLMIAAFAVGARVLSDDKYKLAAENAVKFIFNKLVRDDGRLMARYREGEAAYLGYVDDYAFLIWSLIELYEVTYDPDYLKKALKLNDDLLNLFWDQENGGLFLYGSDSEQLITRPKEIYDGATPSGNAVAALNFLRLARLTGQHELENKAQKQFDVFGGSIKRSAVGHAFSQAAFMFAQIPGKEVVIVEGDDESTLKKMLQVVREDFRPFTVSLVCFKNRKTLKSIAPFIEGYNVVNGQTTAYVCENFTCQAPVTDPDKLRDMLSS